MNVGRLFIILVLLALVILIALTIRAAIITESLISNLGALAAAGEWYTSPFGLCPMDSCWGGLILPPESARYMPQDPPDE